MYLSHQFLCVFIALLYTIDENSNVICVLTDHFVLNATTIITLQNIQVLVFSFLELSSLPFKQNKRVDWVIRIKLDQTLGLPAGFPED